MDPVTISTLLASVNPGNVLGGIADFGAGWWNAGEEKDAARQQARDYTKANEDSTLAIRQALQAAQGRTSQAGVDARGNVQPYMDVGSTSAGTLADFIKNGGLDQKYQGKFDTPEYQDPGSFKADPFNYKASPGFQNILDQSRKADEASGAARGMLASGQTIRQIGTDAGNLASRDYQNELNNYNNDRAFKYDQFTSDKNFGRNNFNNDRNYGYSKYRDDLTDFQKSLADKYDRLFQGTQLGASVGSKLNDQNFDLLQEGNLDTRSAGQNDADYFQNDANIKANKINAVTDANAQQANSFGNLFRSITPKVKAPTT